MMDSGNSGSLQSSSGGGDEFDSRGGGGGGGVDSSPLSALLRPTPSPSAAGVFSLHGSLYGLQEFTSAPPQQQQQQAPWSAAQFMAGGSSSSPRVEQPSDAGMSAGAHQVADLSATAQCAPAAPPRGSRKRARASRRAPTTVLTTDTSNFRAMVQEFTGFPNPPFAAGASFLSRSFDHIFPSTSTLRSAGADPTSSLPPYLLRPFAQKLQTAAPSSSSSPFPPFTSPPSSAPPSSSNIGVANANATTANTASQRVDDFQLMSSALLRMQQQQDHGSSYLSFQNLGSTQPSSQHMVGGAGMSHAATRLPEPSPSEFMAGVGGGTSIGFTHGGMMVSEAMHMHPRNDVHEGGGGDELSGVVRAGASGCKLNYTSHAGASSASAAASTDMPPDGASRPS